MVLEMFRSNRFEDVSLNQWMALTPKEIVESNIHVGPQVMDSLRKEKRPVVKYPGFHIVRKMMSKMKICVILSGD